MPGHQGPPDGWPGSMNPDQVIISFTFSPFCLLYWTGGRSTRYSGVEVFTGPVARPTPSPRTKIKIAAINKAPWTDTRRMRRTIGPDFRPAACGVVFQLGHLGGNWAHATRENSGACDWSFSSWTRGRAMNPPMTAFLPARYIAASPAHLAASETPESGLSGLLVGLGPSPGSTADPAAGPAAGCAAGPASTPVRGISFLLFAAGWHRGQVYLVVLGLI